MVMFLLLVPKGLITPRFLVVLEMLILACLLKNSLLNQRKSRVLSMELGLQLKQGRGMRGQNILMFQKIKKVHHLNHLSRVPGYTFLVDEVTPSKMAEGGKPARSALDDACLNVNGSKSVKEDAARRKAVSGPQPSIDTHTFRSLAEFQKKSSRPKSMSNDMPFDAFEIGLGRHPPSSSPSNSSYNNGGENTSMNSKFGVSRNDASRDALGDYSPAFSDEEIDANSDAAASVAALRKAIEEAQMKIKIAKELMERKKEGLQNRAKTSFNNGWKAQKSGVKTAERSKRSNELGDQEMHEKEDTPKQVITGLPEHNVTKASQLPQSFEDEKKSSFANNVVRKTHSMESKSTRTDSRLEEAEDWESTEEFFEAADYEEHREMPSEYEAGNAEKMVSYDHENKWREKMTAEEKIKMPERGEETFKEHKVERELSSEEFFEAADYEEHREMPSEYEAGNAEKMVSYDHENKWREKMTAEEKIKTPECGEETFKEYKVERELNSVVGAFQWNLYANFVKPAGELHNQEENEEKMRISNNHEEAEQTSIVSDDWEDCETKLEKLHHPYKKAEFPIREFEENGEMKELKDAQDSVETEKKQREALDHKEMENRSDEVPITDDEYDGSLDDIYEKEANVEGQQEDWDRVECGMKQGGWNLKENEEKQNDLHRGEISGEDGGIEGSAKLEELKEDEEILKRSDQMNEIEKRGEKMCEGIETERIRSESHQGGEDRKAMEVTEQSLRYEGGNLETAKDEQEKKNLGESDNAWGRTTNFAAGDLKTQVLTAEENGRLMEVTEFSPLLQGTEQESKAVKDANSPEEQDCEIACLAQGFIGLDRIKKQTADVTEDLLIGENGVYFGENDVNFENKQNHHVTEYKSMPNQEKCVEDVTIELDDNGDVDICEPEVHAINEESEKSSISSHNERWSSDETESLCDPECCIEEAACEFGENNNDINESEVTANHENSFESSHDDRWVDNGINTKASQQPCIFKGQGEITEKSVEEELSQSTSKKEENCCKNLAMEEKECEDDLRKEVEVEKKHLKKKEKMKEGEVEREKERIAVERAIREARERAFAEARERAAIERAAAEAHQRSKAEVRERLEKAPSEANNKSAAEKASSEAKLKAERAAVERATAEARQRALEKALSEKAAFEARNQAEKSTAERLSSISKANGMNSRDKQYNDPGPSSSSRYPGSSNHGESANGGNGESAAQRSKATLERHQRTAERAAKALAEKNMRDLLAQKEQAERNRLAETLDADVKRWSSGKERNLRALLSTLQYILCPDSGWQSIPLTELVSSTAVKKAYRKATLFVHPDKLQQRGASIQQKYICEKVFDLLKDAWNKVSAEER
uniref:J domain-containing protein n=1 Tax=Populus trichocarpa TaxID=3694 RepID=A0A2K2AL10_POPTR|eukprot:XP_024457100.1 auxilin-like protein 1 isoform X3 [Populus trichocarpa]